MITIDLARQLVAAGLVWVPASGDRFVVPDRDMDDEIFTLSEMTVEIHEFPTGKIIGFNGTTEWALDSIEQQDVVWLPREDQLRDLLGESFVRLEAVPGGFVAVAQVGGQEQRHLDIYADRAYARCLLAILRG